MRHITICDKPLRNISKEDLLEIAVIEGCCASLDEWNYPIIVEYDNTMFYQTVWIAYKSTRKVDGIEAEPINFFFRPDIFRYHFYKENDIKRWCGERLGLKAIRFLIEKGYDVPIY